MRQEAQLRKLRHLFIYRDLFFYLLLYERREGDRERGRWYICRGGVIDKGSIKLGFRNMFNAWLRATLFFFLARM